MPRTKSKSQHKSPAKKKRAAAESKPRESPSGRGGASRGDASAGPRPLWSGTISFGLVSVPVILVSAVRSSGGGTGVRMTMLAPDGTPLNRRYYDAETDREIHSEHLLRGYEYEKDKYIVIRDEELESLAPEKSRDIDLRRFVDLAEIDSVYFDRPYYLLPATESNKAYRLLAATMESSGKAGIATFVMREKEYLIAIIAEGGLLRAETLRFHDEIRTPEQVGLPEPRKAGKSDVQKVEREMRKLTEKELDLADMTDAYARRMLDLIESKQESGEDVVESEEAASDKEVEDLVAALKESMARTQRKNK